MIECSVIIFVEGMTPVNTYTSNTNLYIYFKKSLVLTEICMIGPDKVVSSADFVNIGLMKSLCETLKLQMYPSDFG